MMKTTLIALFTMLATAAYAHTGNADGQTEHTTAHKEQTKQKGYYTQYYGNNPQLVDEAHTNGWHPANGVTDSIKPMRTPVSTL